MRKPDQSLIVVIAFSIILIGCGRGPASDSEAREMAKKRFSQACTNFHLVATDYDGPTSTAVGGAAFAYEWRKKEKKQEGVLITVASDGVTNVSFLTP